MGSRPCPGVRVLANCRCAERLFGVSVVWGPLVLFSASRFGLAGSPGPVRTLPTAWPRYLVIS